MHTVKDVMTTGVVAVVSKSDLLLKAADPDAGEEFRFSPEGRREQHKAAGTTAADVMTAPAITVPTSATVEEAAQYMRRHKIVRLPVIDALRPSHWDRRPRGRPFGLPPAGRGHLSGRGD